MNVDDFLKDPGLISLKREPDPGMKLAINSITVILIE